MDEVGPVRSHDHGTPRVRILIVDDSELSRNYIVRVLEQLPNAELVAVDSGAAALRVLADGAISLMLCDYEMPNISGLQVLSFARKTHNALDLPVLMLTSRDEPGIKVKAFRAGANDYIAKEAEPEELLARVSTQIELLQAHRTLDDTRLRKSEHQKFEAIGHLAEGLAHELNTPAQYIQDNLDFLAESFEALGAVVEELRQLPSAAERSLVEAVLERIEYSYMVAEVPRCIRESRQGIDHVAGVVAVMREFARPGIPEHSAHSLNVIIKGAVAVTRGQWHQVAELELELLADMPLVQCIGVAIKQVVLYALMNAVKTMLPRGGRSSKGRVKIRTLIEPDWARIEICNSGSEAASALADNVGDPVLGAGEAEGHALAHARTVVVDEHHGTLEVRSSPDGTTMVIRLPLPNRVAAMEPPAEL
jgi:CheY-like chemotaxis protein